MRSACQLILLSLLLTTAALAGAVEGEYQVKAAMLYNFAKFVEWPADSFSRDNHITFCIAGKSPLSGTIQQMQGKQVKGRTVSIRQIARPEEVDGCQILFIAPSDTLRMNAYLQQASRSSILTVSDQERFAASGGMIGFYEEESKIRFEINQEAAQKRRLQISSHLLNLARRVR
jgi:phosphatidylserine decarboxylase